MLTIDFDLFIETLVAPGCESNCAIQINWEQIGVDGWIYSFFLSFLPIFVLALKSIFWITLNIFCLNLSWDLKNNFTWPSFLFSKFFFGTLSQFLGSLLFPRNFYVKGIACTLTKKRKMWSSFKQTDDRSSTSLWLNEYVFRSRKRQKLDIKWAFVRVGSF